jgi:hypothetical protein
MDLVRVFCVHPQQLLIIQFGLVMVSFDRDILPFVAACNNGNMMCVIYPDMSRDITRYTARVWHAHNYVLIITPRLLVVRHV